MNSFSSLLQAQNSPQLSITDYIAVAKENADKDWYAKVLEEVHQMCFDMETFCIDDLHERLEKKGVETFKMPAFGPIMDDAKNKGWCAATDTPRRSKRKEAHGRFVNVWKSLLYF